MQSADILINEIQLGPQLGMAVHQSRGRDFALLLSMMSQNVLDNAQFSLPSDSAGGEDVDEAALRRQLGLGDKTPFDAQQNSATQAILLGVDVHTEGMAEVKLKGYLQPEPLSRQDDPMYIEPQVIGNCDQTVMQRYFMQENRISERLEHNEAGLYEVLEGFHTAA